jgi:O-antigen/teichoic acid export membrane protein
MLLINNGVSNALINYIVEDRYQRKGENIKKIIFTGFTINIFLSIIVTFFLYVLSGIIANQIFSQPEIKQLIQILSITIIGQALLITSTAVLVGLEKMAQRSISNIIYSLLKTIIGPVLVFLGYNLIGAAYGLSTPFLFTGIFGMFLVYFNLGKPSLSTEFKTEYLQKIINYSSPLFISNLLSGIFNQTLSFILPFYVSTTLIGNLSAARSFNVLISFFIVPISVATFPLLSKITPARAL